MLRNRRPGAQRDVSEAVRRRLQELAFSLLYGPAARFYDRFAEWLFLGEWERWQRTALQFLPPTGVIVELGSGTGQLARHGVTPERTWIGVERSRSMVRVARRRATPAGPWFVLGDVTALPIRSGAASAVVATFPTRFILDDGTATEVCRILAGGAPLVVILSGELTGRGLRRGLRRFALRRFYGRQQRGAEAVWSLAGMTGRHHRVMTDHGVASLFVAYAGGDEPS